MRQTPPSLELPEGKSRQPPQPPWACFSSRETGREGVSVVSLGAGPCRSDTMQGGPGDGGATLAEVADPRPAALQPCPPPSQRRIWAGGKGLSGWLPTLRACCGHSSGTKGACWLCVRSAGPRGHLGSTRSQAGLPQAAFEGWGISSSSRTACWRVAHLAGPVPSHSHSPQQSPRPRPGPAGEPRDKGECLPPHPF